jgi:hypothetical protein
VSDTLPAERYNVRGVYLRARLAHYDRVYGLTPDLVGDADDRTLRYSRALCHDVFHFD